MRRQCPVQRRTRLSRKLSRPFAWPPEGLALVRVFALPGLQGLVSLGLVSLGLVSLGLVGLFFPRGFQGLVRLRLMGVFVFLRLGLRFRSAESRMLLTAPAMPTCSIFGRAAQKAPSKPDLRTRKGICSCRQAPSFC